MAIDANIPLAFAQMGSNDPQTMLNLLEGVRKMRAYEQEEQTNNEIRSVFARPGAFDEKGNLTTAAIQDVFALNPKAGGDVLRLKTQAENQDALEAWRVAQAEAAHGRVANARNRRLQNAAMEHAAGADRVYREAKSSGLSEDESRRKALSSWQKVVDAAKGSGEYSNDELKQFYPEDLTVEDFGTLAVLAGGEHGLRQYVAENRVRSTDERTGILRDRQTQDAKDDAEKNAIAKSRGRMSEMTARLNLTSGKELSHDAVEYWSEVVLRSGEIPMGMRRNAVAASQIMEAVARKAKERGIDAAAILNNLNVTKMLHATSTQMGRILGKTEPYAAEAYGMADLALKASAAVPRGEVLPMNILVQEARKYMSDPRLARFKAANISLANAYVKTVNPVGAGSMQERVHMYSEILNTAQGPEAYIATVTQMKEEIEAATVSVPRAAPKTLGELQKGYVTGLPQTTQAASPVKGLPNEGQGAPKSKYAGKLWNRKAGTGE